MEERRQRKTHSEIKTEWIHGLTNVSRDRETRKPKPPPCAPGLLFKGVCLEGGRHCGEPLHCPEHHSYYKLLQKSFKTENWHFLFSNRYTGKQNHKKNPPGLSSSLGGSAAPTNKTKSWKLAEKELFPSPPSIQPQ